MTRADVYGSMNMIVEFCREAVKLNAFLRPNEHPERICLYLVRQFEAELVKIGHIFDK